jgi:hypothetical protein
MPVIPLLQASYDDVQDLKRIIDKYNENFRYLDWLLNHMNLDTANFSPTTIQIVPPEEGKDTVVDPFGINPEYIKFSPNKCYNSSFEVFDSETLKPDYWDTDGIVSPDATFADTYSLKLTAGQGAQQKEVDGEGLYDPAWVSWTPDTRFSFRAKGNGGKVTVCVLQGGVPQPLWVWVTNAKGQKVKQTTTSPHAITFDAGVDWPVSLRTFAVTPGGSGPITLAFVNTGSVDIYIDAITLEPDWTGRWPSFYTHGPHSAPVAAPASDTYLEYGSADWSSAGAEFVLENGYTDAPVVTAGIEGTNANEVTAGITLFTKHIQATVNGVADCYSKIQVIPRGTSIPTTLTGGKITLMAVCTGMVSRV